MRDPPRDIASGPYVLSPCDGKVKFIFGPSDQRLQFVAFLRPWDVHVVRAPADGVIVKVRHVPGKHHLAFGRKTYKNEHLDIYAQQKDGSLWRVVLLAGAFMRRCYARVKVGDRVEAGQRIGHITLGSQVRLFYESAEDYNFVETNVWLENQTVRAGQPLATIKSLMVPS